jgi:hypothetical protein
LTLLDSCARCLIAFCLFVLAAAFSATSASAQTPTLLVDTGPGSNASCGCGLALIPSNVANGNFQFVAGRFTLTVATSVELVEGWMGPVFAGGMQVHIRSDANGLPGNSVFSKTYSMVSASNTNWRSFPDFKIDLSPGSYWLAFEPSSAFSSMPSGVASPLEKYAFYFRPNGTYLDVLTTTPPGTLNFGMRVFGSQRTIPQLLSSLISDVLALNLGAGISNSFDSKITHVLAALDELNLHNTGAALNGLYAFISEVEAQRGKTLTDAQADLVISEVRTIIEALER